MKQAIHHLRTNDPVLSAIIEQVGDYGIQFRPADFETLVKSIVFQQLSGRVASVIFGRLSAAVKGVVTPETILKLRPSRMRSLGLSTQKTAYIREFMMPCYKKLTGMLHDHRVKNIIVDSDGHIWKMIPLFMEGGVTGMGPMEVAAGMDVVEGRKGFPRLQIDRKST